MGRPQRFREHPFNTTQRQFRHLSRISIVSDLPVFSARSHHFSSQRSPGLSTLDVNISPQSDNVPF